jgi:hypothetical protein
MDVVDYNSVASSNRSVAVQPALLRSCLKKQNNSVTTQSDGSSRHVQFGEVEVTNELEIESLKGQLNLWANKDDHKLCRQRDEHIVETDAMVRLYIDVHDGAYTQLNSGNGAVSETVQRGMIRGVIEGYRTLELHSDKRQSRDHHSKFVVDEYERQLLDTPMGNDKDDRVAQQLRKHSERLSRGSRQWAAFMGFVDECAVAVECETSTLEDCIWTPPVPPIVTAAVTLPPTAVVNTPPTKTTTQHQESLVYETMVAEKVSEEEKPTVTTTLECRSEAQQDELDRALWMAQRRLRPNAPRIRKWHMKDFLGTVGI